MIAIPFILLTGVFAYWAYQDYKQFKAYMNELDNKYEKLVEKIKQDVREKKFRFKVIQGGKK